MHFPRRTIEELAAIYALEKEIRDIYVEGPTDKSFIRWFLEESGLRFTVIYEIDDIDVPADLVATYAVDAGSRGRVIALAHVLEDVPLLSPPQACCVADLDLDRYFGVEYSCAHLLFSDYTSLEMYVCNTMAIRKFIRIYCRKTSIRSGDVLISVAKVAGDLFAMRLALIKLGLKCKWVSIERSLTYTNGELTLDSNNFVDRLLSSGSCHTEKESFLSTVEVIRNGFTGDLRNEMHGHDFVRAFAYFFRRRFGDNVLFNEKVIERSLLLCADKETLSRERLFQRITARVSTWPFREASIRVTLYAVLLLVAHVPVIPSPCRAPCHAAGSANPSALDAAFSALQPPVPPLGVCLFDQQL